MMVVILIYTYSKSQKEGFWGWNYMYNVPSPCVQDMFGYVSCDPMYNYMYPGYFYTPNPYIYNSPEVVYRRLLY